MKFIIFICSRIQHGEYPRLPEFLYNEDLEKYIYQGRELTVDEFNAAAAVVFDPFYRSDRYQFQPQIIDEETVIKLEASREAKAKHEESLREARLAAEAERAALVVQESPESEQQATEVFTDETQTEELPAFFFEGRQIHLGDDRVAGLFGDDDQLRVRSEFAELRPAIEAWLESQPTQ